MEYAAVRAVKGVFAEYERAKILERMRRGKLYRARNEGWPNWTIPPCGYRNVKGGDGRQRAEINEEEAARVREVYRWVLEEGMGAAKCARRLNELGVRPRRSRFWRTCTVYNMLTRPLYAGTAYYNRKEAAEPKHRRKPSAYVRELKSSCRIRPREQWIPIAVPAIVTPEQQSLAREELGRHRINSPRKTRYEYLLRTLVVCGECGWKMGCISAIGRYRENEYRYPYYSCGRRKTEATGRPDICRARHVRSDWLDDAVWQSLREWLQKPDVLRAEMASLEAAPDGTVEFASREWERLDASAKGHERQIQRFHSSTPTSQAR